MKRSLEIIVIGGGAAGFFGAIACGEKFLTPEVTILEAGQHPLAKVRISGGGRCNVTHHCFEPAELVQAYPRGGKALRGAFTRFQPQDTVKWFEAHDVSLKTEADGRMFPLTDDSATIVDCLQQAAGRVGVTVRTQAAVRTLTKVGDRFEIELRSGERLSCDRVLLATGSHPLGYRWAEALGHSIVSPVPSLFTFQVADRRLQDLAGIAVPQVQVQLRFCEESGNNGFGNNGSGPKLQQTGDLLITHWGLSGPAILKLSAWGARVLAEQGYRLGLRLNWLPHYSRDALQTLIWNQRTRSPRKRIVNEIDLPLPKRLWQRFTSTAGIASETVWADLSKKQLQLLLQELTQGDYTIQGKGAFKDEFVTCGGINLKEVNFKTMESKRCPGLFLAGELLDIDGVTGGFNFQSAWTTGWLAGQALGEGWGAS